VPIEKEKVKKEKVHQIEKPYLLIRDGISKTTHTNCGVSSFIILSPTSHHFGTTIALLINTLIGSIFHP